VVIDFHQWVFLKALNLANTTCMYLSTPEELRSTGTFTLDGAESMFSQPLNRGHLDWRAGSPQGCDEIVRPAPAVARALAGGGKGVTDW